MFEELVSPGEEVRCPGCSSEKVTKELSAFSVGRGTPRAGGGGGGCASGACGGGVCGL